MKIKDKIYYCNQCKKIVSSIDDLFFVEDRSSRGFCSESCIEKYFAPIVVYYKGLETDARIKHNVEIEDCMDMITDPIHMEKLLREPDEIWCLENILGNELFSFIKQTKDARNNNVFLIALAFVFDRQPSFILLATATQDSNLLNEFKIGNRIVDSSQILDQATSFSSSMLSVDQELVSLLESKKSILLAELLESRQEDDIPYEDFSKFDEYMKNTLEAPDEVFSYKDDVGDLICTFIKAHEQHGHSFYYFVICVHFESGPELDMSKLIPVLSFPSNDGELYKAYQKGERVSGSPKS